MDKPLCTKCNLRVARPGRSKKEITWRSCDRCSRTDEGMVKKRQRIYQARKAEYFSLKKDHCESCGFVAVHRCQLDIDHIDGDHKNNSPDNLQTLCANCHRLKTFLGNEFLPVAHRKG